MIEDASAALDVAANDTAPSGPVTVVDVGRAAHGRATLGPGGVVRYAPDADYNGTDSWSYTARDDDGDTAQATVRVTITPVNDAPVAADDTLRVAEDSGAAALRMLANDADADGDALTVTSVSDPQHGAVKGSSAVGFSYLPAGDFNGTDHLTYTVSDGHGGSATAAVAVVVVPVNDAPVVGPAAYAATVGHRLTVVAADGALANASDVDGDGLTVVGDDSPTVDIAADGSISYLPLLPGTRAVDFRVSDGHVTTTGTLTITVTLAPTGSVDLYLQPSDTDVIGPMDTSAPTGGLSDWDADRKPGLTIKSSDLKESITDVHKFQTWSDAVPTGGLDLKGPVTLDLWTSLQDKAHQDLVYSVWVYDCGPGGSCVTLLATGKVLVADWSTTTTWEEREITLGSVNDSLPNDHSLRLRLMFNKRDVWMPLDAAHPSKLTLTTG